MKVKSGIVIKVTEKYVVLIMPDGSFKNVRRAKNEVPLIGERIEYKEEQYLPFYFRWKAFAAVACFIILAALTYRLFMMDNYKPAYLVALDVNPSIEVYADKNLLTMKVTALNEDGRGLADMTKYKGKKIFETIDLIIEQIIDAGYFDQDDKNLIKITVVPMQKNNAANESNEIYKSNINESYINENIKDSIQNLLSKDNIQAEVEISSQTRDVVEEAHRSGLSVNRYILYKSLKDKGISITVEESKNMPLKNLQKYETIQNNENNGITGPSSNAGGGVISNNRGNSKESGYDKEITDERKQNGESSGKGNASEMINDNDEQKRRTDSSSEAGISDKMGIEESKIGGLHSGQTKNGSNGNGKIGDDKTDEGNNGISAPATDNAQPDKKPETNQEKQNQNQNQNGVENGNTDKDRGQFSSNEDSESSPAKGYGSGSLNSGKKW